MVGFYILEQYGPEVQAALDKIIALGPATEEVDGLLTAEDKAKLDALGITYNNTVYWAAHSSYVPAVKEIVVYSDFATTTVGGQTVNVPGIKVGDGVKTVAALAFLGADIADRLLAHTSNGDIHVTTQNKDAWNAKYDKPGTGIPKTDLASGVQDSLGAADTAYQKPAVGIPASDIASGVIPDVSGKADKSEMSVVDGSGADADKTTITLKTDTSATVLKSHQDVSGKADKVTGAMENNFAALDANGNLKDSGHKHSDYITSHQDISGKADKVSNAISGNFAELDSNGNLTDSGHKHSDYLTSHQDISGKEDKSNKVTSISDSSTDTEYPSAKCVNDAIKGGSVAESLRMRTESKPNQSIVFRESGKTIGTDSLTLDSIKGKSLAWNQLLDKATYEASVTMGDITYTNNGDGSITANGTPGENTYYMLNAIFGNILNTKHGHKIYIFGGRDNVIISSWNNIDGSHTGIFTVPNGEMNANDANIVVTISDFQPVNNVKVWPQAIDLTLMFGAGNEPTTVAEFEAMFPEPYYPYNPGELISNDAKALETVGFNQCATEPILLSDLSLTLDKSKATHLHPGTYYLHHNVIGATSWRHYFRVFDNGGNFITDTNDFDVRDAYYNDGNKSFVDGADNQMVEQTIIVAKECWVYFAFGSGDTSSSTRFTNFIVNLSDASRNGQYEPYRKSVLPLNLDKIKVKSPNIWDEEWELGSIDDSNGQNVAISTTIRSKNFIPVFPNTVYYNKRADISSGYYFYDANGNYLVLQSVGQYIFTTPQNAAYMRFVLAASYGTTYNNDICINKSDPAFNGRYFHHGVLTLTGGLKGDGEWRDYITNGQKYHRKANRVNLGDFTWVAGTKTSGTIMYSDGIDNSIKKPISDNVIANVICQQFVVYSNNYSERNGVGLSINTDGFVFIFTPYTDPTAFKAAMDGVYLDYELANEEVYELATPLPISTFSGTTEERISPNQYGLSAPLECDITYGTNNEQLLDAINAKADSVGMNTTIAMLDALKAASIIADYSITWGDNGPEVVITNNNS